ncbi:hypothetical protein [Anaeromyxobacter sp. SG66]|uniref:hypothetical protein n=1 Tax=Anaeromyxobacter sp. SG66 TaxID=2925410 RepID=UPI001F5AD982|nr:hypothetical protein [Anaeromyxobacter sp. SG66]
MNVFTARSGATPGDSSVAAERTAAVTCALAAGGELPSPHPLVVNPATSAPTASELRIRFICIASPISAAPTSAAEAAPRRKGGAARAASG